MATTQKKKRVVKILAILVGGLGLLLLGFHLWFVHHAESLVEDMVRRQSNGKVDLRVKNFKFNWFSKRMEMEQATFFSTDTAATTSYLFAVKKIRIQVQSVWPLLFEKKFFIDSLQLFDPDISVTKRKTSSSDTTAADSSLSIPQEMGRIYHSIQDALEALEVNRFQIYNGSFSLFNPSRPDELPVRISRIDMHLDNLKIDSLGSDAENKILFSDNVSLETHHQDILFPDGRHRLSFRDFRIDTRNRLVEFDSCTIEASRGDSSKSSFRIFFDQLRITNIDFDTLYHAEVIKADSVYAYNPRFQLNVDIAPNSPVAPPRLDELIQQLTGQLDVAFVIVENGSFDINTMRAGRPSSFTSDDNNFSLEGLQIRKGTSRPVAIDRFEMAIRNYENFIRDSAYAIQFDSILINDNRISLSNFTYNELERNRTFNQLRMRQLELYGLSWDDLVFDQRLRAEQVTLINPDIRYDIENARSSKRSDIFEILAGLSKSMQLERLHIIQGQVELKLPHKSNLKLSDATILLQTKQLLQATKARDMRDAIQYLDFKTGRFTTPLWNAELTDGQFIGGQNKALAASVKVSGGDSLQIHAQKVEAPLMVFDEYMQLQSIEGLRWSNASIRATLGNQQEKLQKPELLLTNLIGGQTIFELEKSGRKAQGTFKNLAIREWKSGGTITSVAGIAFSLSHLQAGNESGRLNVASWEERDREASVLKDLSYEKSGALDTIQIKVPELKLQFSWNELLQGNQQLALISLTRPEFDIRIQSVGDSEVSAEPISIKKLKITDPQIRFHRKDDLGTSSFQWLSNVGDSISFDDLQLQPGKSWRTTVSSINFLLRGMEQTSQKGKKFTTGKGVLKGEIKDVQTSRNDLGGWDWKARIERLQASDFELDSVGQRKGTIRIHTADIRRLQLQSSSLIDLPGLVSQNPNLLIEKLSGNYTDSIDQFYWNNVSYDKLSQLIQLDSFRYSPTADLTTFTKRQQFQTDYVHAGTGKLKMGPVAIELFARDSILSVGNLIVEDGYMIDYRDKRIPREPGIVRALPGNLLRKLPFRFKADSILVANANVEYEEMDEKTNKAGRITATQLNGQITEARNFDHSPGDSLRIYVEGLLADHIPTRLWVKESYTDTAGGFRMRVEMDEGNLAVLNPILIALARAELKSGELDSLRMDVTGQETFAYGTMYLYYDNLKVRVIRDKPKSLGNRLINFFANTIIKNRNKGKGGTVYVERLRDRSAINYLVKITLSGVMTNAGIKKPAREARKNKKSIRQMIERQQMN